MLVHPGAHALPARPGADLARALLGIRHGLQGQPAVPKERLVVPAAPLQKGGELVEAVLADH